MTIDIEQLRKDMEAQVFAELMSQKYLALREAADALAELVSDSMEAQTEFATEWDVAAHKALEAYKEAKRKATA